MNKFLLPWERIDQSSNFARVEFGAPDWQFSAVLYRFLPFRYELEIWDISEGGALFGPSKKFFAWHKTHAMQKADKILIEQGFTLISGERAERLRLLL